jgi:phage baseplate assembly protein W
MAQLQPIWPLKIDPFHGPYAAIEDVAQSIHQDFLQLLKTMPGEWPGRPDLGIGLTKYLFELPNSHELNSVKERIQNQVSKYLKVVEVTNIDIQTTPDLVDYNQARVVIEYYIKPLGMKKTLGLHVSPGNVKSSSDFLQDPLQEKSPYHVRGSL